MILLYDYLLLDRLPHVEKCKVKVRGLLSRDPPLGHHGRCSLENAVCEIAVRKSCISGQVLYASGVSLAKAAGVGYGEAILRT